MTTLQPPARGAVILDCDPGIDDAVAIMLAQGNPEVELAAITTVGGNAPLESVTRNALAVAGAAGVSAPIAAGCDRPLIAAPENAGHIHGEDGIGGVELAEHNLRLDDRHAVQLIIDTVMEREPGSVTLVPVGPMTNIAMAARQEPRIVERVREVVFMGGAYATGNASPVAEFNVFADPEAASVTLGAGWPITMVGLDLTHQAVADTEVIASISAIDTASARVVADMLEAYGTAYRADGRGFTGAAVHDPCAVARVIAPALLTCKRAPLVVELHGTHTRGMTVADLRRPAPDACLTQVATRLDVDGYWDLVRDALSHLP